MAKKVLDNLKEDPQYWSASMYHNPDAPCECCGGSGKSQNMMGCPIYQPFFGSHVRDWMHRNEAQPTYQVPIKFDYAKICDFKPCDTMVLQVIENWCWYSAAVDNMSWVEMSGSEMQEELYWMFSTDTIKKAVDRLVDRGFVERSKNPDEEPYRGDFKGAWHYRINRVVVDQALEAMSGVSHDVVRMQKYCKKGEDG
jgi:hypothetical protein